jgi:hypothetical protein
VGEEGQDVRQVAPDQLGCLDHRHQARVGCPEVPALPVAFGPADAGIVPELAQALLDRPGAAGLEGGGLELGESLPVLLRQILKARRRRGRSCVNGNPNLPRRGN